MIEEEDTTAWVIGGVIMLTLKTVEEATQTVQIEGEVSGTGKVVRAIPITAVHATIHEQIVDLKGMNIDATKAHGNQGDMKIVTKFQTAQAFKATDRPSTAMIFATPTMPGLGVTPAASNL